MVVTKEPRIAVIGLGYVGLPLAVAFGKQFTVLGYDVNPLRIAQLRAGVDITLEADADQIRSAQNVSFTDEVNDLRDCTVFVITVPTPIDNFNKPDLSHLSNASTLVGKLLKKGDTVIYESTVYPGCTEEDCVPILERWSKLTYNLDFWCGYSPERINPGDKVRTLSKITKITSGSNAEAAEFVDGLYQTIIEAGTYKAPSIKVAEAAKAIENAQRDINISFVNELSLIFDRMGIDTNEVLDAAATKWNFLPFRPGLVGGHCIGVDPYYLVHKAQSLGYHPQVISSGRLVNDRMGTFVAKKILKRLIANGVHIQGSRILILGFTFKENCPDIRNTKIIDVYRELVDFGLHVDVHDPWASVADVKRVYEIDLLDSFAEQHYDGIVLAVAHQQFLEIDLSQLRKNGNSVVFDVKGVANRQVVDLRL